MSDSEEINVPTGADSDEGSPRNTVEDNGLDEDEDDLFGDGGDEDENLEMPRQLDDEDLDSGDDEGRNDRLRNDSVPHDEVEQQTFNFMDAPIARHAVPEPSDGELYLLKIPHFLAFDPHAWNYKNYQAPTTDHHSKGAPSEHFSAFTTAMSTIHWRRSPSDPSQIQSNARILRWSDGSLTLQFASDAFRQYEINASELAPPQFGPKKPTPTSKPAKAKGREYKESYTYLAAPYEEATLMRVTNKLTTNLSVVPPSDAKDGALEQLQTALAQAASRGRDAADNAISFVQVTEDPELVRAREEASFKEKQRQARAKEKHELREREKANRTFGRSDRRSTGYGLSLGGLEDEEGGRRSGARKPKPKSRLQRDWSSDEDYGIKGRTREDDYDEEDDFIAASDEEEIVEDDEDEDDGIIESPRNRRGGESPKRKGTAAEEESEDEDVVVSRSKRRRVVEDDDDEDE